jgi:acetyl-CoA carboxylase carboxyltransferase component
MIQIPLVTYSCTGFYRTAQETAVLFYTVQIIICYGEATVPKVTVILRKATAVHTT